MSRSKRKNDKYSDEYEEGKARTRFKKAKYLNKQNKWMNKAIKTKDINNLIHISEDDNAQL